MSSTPHDNSERRRRLRRFGAVLLALVAASYAFRVLGDFGLEHTSLVFIGIPALLAWIVASSAPPKTAFGSVMRTTTLALLISWIFLGEAFVCVLFAAPIFYLVGFFIALTKERLEGRGPTRFVPAILLIPLALEGTHPALSTSREREVVVEGRSLGPWTTCAPGSPKHHGSTASCHGSSGWAFQRRSERAAAASKSVTDA